MNFHIWHPGKKIGMIAGNKFRLQESNKT